MLSVEGGEFDGALGELEANLADRTVPLLGDEDLGGALDLLQTLAPALVAVGETFIGLSARFTGSPRSR